MALTEEQLRAFVPRNYFLKEPYNVTVPEGEEEVTTSYGIPDTNAFTNSGGGNNYTGSASNLIGDFNTATRARQKRLEDPNWITQQFNKFTGGGQRPVSEMVTGNVGNFSRMPIDTQNFGLAVSEDEGQYGPMRTFERDQRSLDQIPLGVGSLISRVLPDRYYSDFTLPQQAYTQLNMGYTGPTIFGENLSGANKDIFGRNVRHAGKRSYNETQQRGIDRLDEYWGSEKFGKKYGAGVELEFDEETGEYKFTGVDPRVVGTKLDPNYMNKLNLSRYNYDKAGVLKFNAMNKQHQKKLAKRKRWEDETAREQDWADKKFKETGDYDEYAGAGGTWSGPVGPQPHDTDYADPGVDAEENQPGGNDYGFDDSGGFTGEGWSRGGRVGLNLGGLASMLGREGFADGGLDWDEGGDTPMPGGGHGSGHEDAVAAMGGDNQNNTVVVPKTNYIDIEPHLLREDPYIDLSLMDPLEIAKLQASIGYRDILDNDDISVKGDFTTNIGPVDTNTQFTETGIGDTDINYGNFSTTIDPNKNIKNIGYNSSYNGINYGVNYADGNTIFNVGTTFKNGGLARLL